MKFPIHGKKGQIHTLEAIVAVVIMIIFAFSVFQFYSVQTYESQSVEELKEQGKSVIATLDELGKLEDYIDGDLSAEDFEILLIELLPSDVGFDVSCFEWDGDSWEPYLPSNSINRGDTPALDKPTATVNYIFSSQIDDNYPSYHVKMVLWYL